MKWELPLKNMKYQAQAVSAHNWLCLCWRRHYQQRDTTTCVSGTAKGTGITVLSSMASGRFRGKSEHLRSGSLFHSSGFASSMFPSLPFTSTHGKGRGEVQRQKVPLLFCGACSAVAPYHKAWSLGPSKHAQEIPVVRRRWEGKGT